MSDALKFDPFEGDFGEQGDRTLKDSMVRGRKTYHCSHCCGPIAVGETHRARTDIISGEVMNYRWCSACCSAMVEQMECENDEERFPYEDRTQIHRADFVRAAASIGEKL